MGELVFGVLDSGVGGFSVAAPLLKRFPNAGMIYVADTAYVPYSSKTPKELSAIIGRILNFFLRGKVNAVIFACNTSSALVYPSIRDSFPVPTFGIVEPGVRKAVLATKGKGIGVVANRVTAKSGVFKKLIHEKNPNVPVYEIGCPELVTFVENEDFQSNAVKETVFRYCKELSGKIDTLLFACTHFPFLSHWFKEALPGVTLIDPAFALIDFVAAKFQNPSTLNPIRKLFSTKNAPHVTSLAKKVLEWKTDAEVIDLK